MANKYALVCLLFFSLFGCKKSNENLEVNGQVYNQKTLQTVGNVNIQLFKQSVSNGIVNGYFEPVQTVQADASGNYFLRWERDQAINYKIVASKDNYYSKEIFLNPDNLNIGSEYNQSIPLIAKSSIRLSYAAQTGNYFLNFLINEIPDDCDCESLGNIQIDSPFPSELICESYGDYYLKYVVYSNTGAVVSIDSVYCTPFILTDLQISL